MSQHDVQQQFQQSLRRKLVENRMRLLLHGLLAVFAITGCSTLAIAWVLGRLVAPGVPVKLLLAGLGLAVILAAAYFFLVAPLRRLASRGLFCRQLERDGRFHNVLVSAEEACRAPDRWRQDSSIGAELVRRLFDRASRDVGQLKLGRLLPLRWAGRLLLGAVAVAGIWSLLLVVAADPLQTGYARLLRFWVDESSLPTIGLYLEADPGQVVAGQDVVLSALDFGASGSSAVCEVRSGTGLWRSLECRLDSLAANEPYVRWQTRLAKVRESFAYRFRRGSLVTTSREVTVLHPPVLNELSGRLLPPDYTGLPARDIARIPNYLELLAGSRLIWNGRASQPIRWAAAVTATNDTVPMIVRDDTFEGQLTIVEPLRYRLALLDWQGLPNGSRLTYEVSVLPDTPPAVRLHRPEDDGLIPVSGAIILEADAADDFGLARVDLLVRRDDAESALDPDRLQTDDWRRLTIWRAEAAADSGIDAPVRLELQTGFGPLAVLPSRPDSLSSRLRWQRNLELALDDLDLIPGEVLSLCLEAEDNHQPPPAGRSRSRVLRLTLPSAAEILTAQDAMSDQRLDDLTEIQRRSQALGSDLARMERELMKNPLPDWNRQQELEGAVTQQKQLQEELKALVDQLQNDLASLGENQLTSVELLAKMDEIAELLSDVHSEELDQLLEQLREAVAKLSPEEVQDAVAEIMRNQQEFLGKLDHTLSYLKELEREQELEGMTSLLAKLIREQQDLLDAAREPEPDSQRKSDDATDDATDAATDDATDEASADKAESQTDDQDRSEGPDDAAEQAERQQALAEEMEQLAERLQEALEQVRKEMAEGDSSLSAEMLEQALQQAQQQMAERQPSQSMQDAAERLKDDQPMSAEEFQEQAVRDLAVLYHVLLKSREGMQMALMQNQAVSMRRLAGDLLTLSARQEDIADKVPADLHGMQTQGMTRQQFRVLKATRRLREQLRQLSSQSPGQIVRLLRKIDELIEQLDNSVHSLETGRGIVARQSSRTSLGLMNNIVIALLTQAQKSCSGPGGGQCNMPTLSQQLQSMAREQAGLNALTEQLRQQLQQSRLSQQMRAQMQRLQSEQDQLAGQAHEMAELQRQMQEGERMLGDMEQLAAEMEKIVQDISQGMISDETLARQERILSRLLDAHNSVRQRDFTSRRESRTAGQLFAAQPQATVDQPESERSAPFRLRYQPVEQAPLEYRELVRRYFQAVEELLQNRPEPTSGRMPGGERQ